MKNQEVLTARRVKDIVSRARKAQSQLEQRDRVKGRVIGTIVFRMSPTGVPGMIHEACL